MIYEMRIYHCVTGRLPALMMRFETITLALWERHGIKQAGFWTTTRGQLQPDHSPTWWRGRALRSARRSGLPSSPTREWQAKRAETEKDGAIVANIVNEFLLPTSFSSVK